MTSFIAIIIALICTFFMGRALVISNIRMNKIDNLVIKIKHLEHRINFLRTAPSSSRQYSLEEDDDHQACHVFMHIEIRTGVFNENLDTTCPCLIKSFQYDYGKEFAMLEAQELIDHLNEK